MRVKVCGMNFPDNVLAVDALGVDSLGFVFYPNSPRCVATPPEKLPPTRAKRVGVFVDQDEDEILSAVGRYGLDGVQLHGAESPDFCRRLRGSLPPGTLLVKAVGVASSEDLTTALAYEEVADGLLFDTRCATHGGSGRRFDWSLLSRYRGNLPFLLSGGLGPGDEERVRSFHHPRCQGVDLNSRFELSPGIKDVAVLARFLRGVGHEPSHGTGQLLDIASVSPLPSGDESPG